MVPAKYAFPLNPSRMIPVIPVLLPLALKISVVKYAFDNVAIGEILNALVAKSTQDIQRKKRVAPLMKENPFLLCCRFLLVKLILTI